MFDRRRWAPPGLPLGLLLLALVAAGCGGHPGPPGPGSAPGSAPGSGPPPTPSVVLDGPDVVGLSATAGSGGDSVYAPPGVRGRWRATFGGFVLCLREWHAPARVLAVRPLPDAAARPVGVALWLRTVRRADVAAAPARRRPDFEPVGSALGAPPRWAQPYRDAAYPGRYSPRVRGLVVDQSCAQTAAAGAAIDRGRVPATGYHELMVTLTVDGRGGRVRGLDLSYEQAGRRAVLRARWAMTACGAALGRAEHCRPPKPGR